MATIINASTSAGLIQTADTSGNLNLQSNGSTIVAVTSTGAAVTGTLSATGAVTIPSVAGSFYSTGTYTATATGLTTSPTGTVRFVKIGNIVNLEIPSISGTSNSASFTFTGGTAAMRPASVQACTARCQDNNGAYSAASMVVVGTDGTLSFYKDGNSTGFTTSGIKSTGLWTISYITT